MKRTIFILMAAFFCNGVWAQCPTGNIEILGQGSADNFGATHPDCTVIEGDLIFRNNEIDVTQGFAHIERINGDLRVTSGAEIFGMFTNLDTITGEIISSNYGYGTSRLEVSFPALKHIGGDIKALNGIEGDAHINSSFPVLERMNRGFYICGEWASIGFGDNFPVLKYIGGSIYNGVGFGGLSGLNALETIAGDLIFNATCGGAYGVNFGISGVNQLKYIGGDFSINGFFQFNMDGLNQLNAVGGNCILSGGFSSTSEIVAPTGLTQLQSVGGNFWFQGSTVTNIDFLSQLSYVGGKFDVSFHPYLENLNGLDHPITMGSLAITGNPNISKCTVESVCNHLNTNRSVQIVSNDLGCNTVAEVEAVCNSSCPMEDIILTTQQEVDNFSINYAGCVSVTDNLIIKGITATAITNLDGLQQILSISDTLFIIDNQALTDISGLENIDYSTIGHMQISGNSTLSACNITNICKFIASQGTSSIYNNAQNCNSAMEVLDNCTVCPESSIVLNSQADVDQYGILYPGCADMPYSITVEGADINNLNALSDIKHIQQTLTIKSCDALTNLSGLDNLESIGYGFKLYHNYALVDISSLHNLNSVGAIDFVRSDALPNLAGLENLQHIGATLRIIGNYLVTDLTVFSSLDSLKNIILYSNDNLVSMDGLQNLTYLENISILDNDNLVSLEGLNNVVTAQDVEISGNTALQSLQGLNSLTSVSGSMIINPYSSNRNSALQTLSGLENLTSTGRLLIYGNPVLKNINALQNLNTIDGNFRLDSNPDLENLDGLENLQTINGSLNIGSGLSFEPHDGNGIYDMDGLSGLTSINGELHIKNNYNLTTLSGLRNLNGNITELEIKSNPSLYACNVPVICNYLTSGDSYDRHIIINNLANCDKTNAVLHACRLPIEILDPLQVYLNNRTAVLTWKTAAETNNSGFEIQRSEDGIQWERIGWQAGQGNSTTPHAYTYSDENPLPGTSYYRFKQVDFDGNFEYSNVVSLQYPYTRTVVDVFPNPSTGIFQVTGITQGSYTIHDTTGRIIQQGELKNDLSIDMSNQAQGVYFISIQIDNGVITKRIIKM